MGELQRAFCSLPQPLKGLQINELEHESRPAARFRLKMGIPSICTCTGLVKKVVPGLRERAIPMDAESRNLGSNAQLTDAASRLADIPDFLVGLALVDPDGQVASEEVGLVVLHARPRRGVSGALGRLAGLGGRRQRRQEMN